MLIGFAFSDVHFVPKKILEDVVELQPETKELYTNTPTINSHVISVHAPSIGRDLSSPHPEFRKFAVREVKEGIKFAGTINASFFVVHPTQFYEYNNKLGIKAPPGYRYDISYFWFHPFARNYVVDYFLESLCELVEYCARNKWKLTFLLENLEYPKFPALPDEIISIYDKVRTSCNSLRIGIVLDMPHLWHSIRILREAHRLSNNVTFENAVEILLDEIRQEIHLIHLAGCYDHKTHEPIIYKKAYSSNELDLYFVADILKSLSLPVILEIYDKPYEVLLKSRRALEEILKT